MPNAQLIRETGISHIRPEQLTIVEGPFHYHIRSSTYGELYDEVPWRVLFGVSKSKSRDAVDRSSLTRSYKNGVLINNWNEERRDREYIKFSRPNPISQYGHMYGTTYGATFGKKRMCDKERFLMRKIRAFPLSGHPGHQPELDVAMLRCCVPKPEVCIEREALEACYKESARQKRIAKASDPPPKPISYGVDMAKCDCVLPC